MSAKIPIPVGSEFGRWKVLAGAKGGGKNAWWLCQCLACSDVVRPVRADRLRGGYSVCCGCVSNGAPRLGGRRGDRKMSLPLAA
jgi:hypothetical protein